MVYSFCWSVYSQLYFAVHRMYAHLNTQYASCIPTPEGCISVSVVDLVRVIYYFIQW